MAMYSNAQSPKLWAQLAASPPNCCLSLGASNQSSSGWPHVDVYLLPVVARVKTAVWQGCRLLARGVKAVWPAR
jgi:hypothetical protein